MRAEWSLCQVGCIWLLGRFWVSYTLNYSGHQPLNTPGTPLPQQVVSASPNHELPAYGARTESSRVVTSRVAEDHPRRSPMSSEYFLAWSSASSSATAPSWTAGLQPLPYPQYWHRLIDSQLFIIGTAGTAATAAVFHLVALHATSLQSCRQTLFIIIIGWKYFGT